MVNILLIALNVLIVGSVIAIVGAMLVRLLRRFLLDGLPPVDEENGEKE